jgi:Raf kinase inhibitor-like YbhB/YbcL family protein
MTSFRTFSAAIVVLLGAILSIGIEPPAARAFEITSPAIQADAVVPTDNTCSGADLSPALQWTGAPTGTLAFALIVADPDAPSGTFFHWVVYDLPSGASGLPPGIGRTAQIAGGGTQGVNSFGKVGYNGPCPPHGRPHHYHFRLYALDRMLDLDAGANAAEVEAAMKGHELASTDLVGTFER